eukprot:TRINITY_DN68281_c0_g1_i1.p1 TRINITY_DN68281_c0_g1~~TRINITY_DN68281_c0_g1_i1.p1  ORF type:complete len:630 (-),score=86.12 TRINITY_DN68281_c0_g1_i1:15-1691(-)
MTSDGVAVEIGNGAFARCHQEFSEGRGRVIARWRSANVAEDIGNTANVASQIRPVHGTTPATANIIAATDIVETATAGDRHAPRSSIADGPMCSDSGSVALRAWRTLADPSFEDPDLIVDAAEYFPLGASPLTRSFLRVRLRESDCHGDEVFVVRDTEAVASQPTPPTERGVDNAVPCERLRLECSSLANPVVAEPKIFRISSGLQRWLPDFRGIGQASQLATTPPTVRLSGVRLLWGSATWWAPTRGSYCLSDLRCDVLASPEPASDAKPVQGMAHQSDPSSDIVSGSAYVGADSACACFNQTRNYRGEEFASHAVVRGTPWEKCWRVWRVEEHCRNARLGIWGWLFNLKHSVLAVHLRRRSLSPPGKRASGEEKTEDTDDQKHWEAEEDVLYLDKNADLGVSWRRAGLCERFSEVPRQGASFATGSQTGGLPLGTFWAAVAATPACSEPQEISNCQHFVREALEELAARGHIDTEGGTTQFTLRNQWIACWLRDFGYLDEQLKASPSSDRGREAYQMLMSWGCKLGAARFASQWIESFDVSPALASVDGAPPSDPR